MEGGGWGERYIHIRLKWEKKRSLAISIVWMKIYERFAAEHKFHFSEKNENNWLTLMVCKKNENHFFALVTRSAASSLFSTDIAFSLGII